MKILLVAASLAALVPAAAQAQETRVEERVVIMAGPGGPMDIGDEGLTREAFIARHNQMFDHMDANQDGILTREEMQAMHAMMMERMGGMHGGDGDHSGHAGHGGGEGDHAGHAGHGGGEGDHSGHAGHAGGNDAHAGHAEHGSEGD